MQAAAMVLLGFLWCWHWLLLHSVACKLAVCDAGVSVLLLCSCPRFLDERNFLHWHALRHFVQGVSVSEQPMYCCAL